MKSKYLSSRSNWIEASPLALIVSKIADLKAKGVSVLSLAAGDPDPYLIPRKELAEIAYNVLKNIPSSLLYTPTSGIFELRKEISRLIEKYDGIKADPQDIVISSGSTIAIDLLIRIILDPGDIVIAENPTYINTLYALRQHGISVIGVPMDNNGMRMDKLEDIIKKLLSQGKKVKLIYTIPTGQNPSGLTMSLERRKYLLEIAVKYDILILEDLAYNYIFYEELLPTLKSMDREERVIAVGTLSKVMGTGFRVGWIIATETITKKIVEMKQPIDFCAPAISQYIALEYLRQGLFEKHHLKILKDYREKRDALIKALETRLPNVVFTRPSAGMFLMLYLPDNADGQEFAEKLLLKYHVAVVPAGPFHPNKDRPNTLRLNFSRPSINAIEEAVNRLAKLYHELYRSF